MVSPTKLLALPNATTAERDLNYTNVRIGSTFYNITIFRIQVTPDGGTTWHNVGDEVLSAVGEMHFQSNATETVIVTQGVPVLVNGVYVSGNLAQFTHVNGVLTYTGSESRAVTVSCICNATLNGVSGELRLLVRDQAGNVTKSIQQTNTRTTSPSFYPLYVQAVVNVSPANQTIEILIANESGTDNVTVGDFNCIATSTGAGGSTPSSTSSGIPVLNVVSSIGFNQITIISAFYQRIDNIVHISARFDITNSLSNASFNLQVPFAPGFTLFNQSNGTSVIQLQATNDPNDGSKVASIFAAIAATDELIFNCHFVTTTGHTVESNFMYQIQ